MYRQGSVKVVVIVLGLLQLSTAFACIKACVVRT